MMIYLFFVFFLLLSLIIYLSSYFIYYPYLFHDLSLRQARLPTSSQFRSELLSIQDYHQREIKEKLFYLLNLKQEKEDLIEHYFRNQKCQHLYIDLGSNTGLQFRKLYEPILYPEALVHVIFDKYFGKSDRNPVDAMIGTEKEKPQEQRKSVCSIGFEANEIHNQRLIQLQSYYQKKGYPIVIFTEIAVGAEDGNITFYHDKGATKGLHEWGASILPWDTMNNMTKYSSVIPLIDLNLFLQKTIYLWKRYLSMPSPSTQEKPHHHLLMKMDIEGSEYSVLPHLLAQGTLCSINGIMIEWHPHFYMHTKHAQVYKQQSNRSVDGNAFKHSFEMITSDIDHCPCKLLEIDDETYFEGSDPHPLHD